MTAYAHRIEKPLVDKTNTAQLFIDAVELTTDSTVVTLHTYSFLNQNIRLMPTLHLESDGKIYNTRNVQGITLGKQIDVPALADSVFTISFDPLPMDTKTFNFIEGKRRDDFRIEGIHTDKAFDDVAQIEEINLLSPQKWEKGTAILTGKIENYNPSEGKTSVHVYPRCALGRYLDNKVGTTQVDTAGNFSVSVPLYQSNQPCFIDAPGLYGLIYLSPGTESSVTIDAAKRWGNGHVGTDGSLTFTGANSELNNQLTLNIGHEMIWDMFLNNRNWNKNYTSMNEYKSDVMRHKATRLQKVSQLPFTPLMRQLMRTTIESDMLFSLSVRNIAEPITQRDSTYYDFLFNADIDNPMLMWAENYDTNIDYLSNMLPLQIAIASDGEARETDDGSFDLEKSIDILCEKFSDLSKKDFPNICQLFASKSYNNFIDERNVLDSAALAKCKERLPGVFYDFLVEQNDYMSEILLNSNVNLLNMESKFPGDEVLKDIAETHNGKVIYIDLWATSCAPCIRSMTELEPKKKQYTDKVSFVYLADESSPKETWEEKSKSIEGEHKRLTLHQMGGIQSRFGFSGYPSYIVIGKDGSVSFSGYIGGAEHTQMILDKEIRK